MKRDKVDKRLTKRMPLTFSNGTSEFQGVSSNLSSEGIFIRTRKALPPGTTLKIVLEVDKDRKIDLEGEVAWSLKTGIADFKNGMGVKLLSMPQTYKDLLNELGI